MRNINIYKVANIFGLVLVTALLVSPLLVAAQFPSAGVGNAGLNSGLPQDTNISVLIIRIINILLAVAGLVAVVFLIVGGFRYITAGGNEESAEAAKTTITNAIIGIVVIILSFVIVRVISNAVVASAT